MSVKVSPKYQVVIPESIRIALDLRPGARIEVIAKGGIAYLVPVPTLGELHKNLKENPNSKKSTIKLREKKDRKL